MDRQEHNGKVILLDKLILPFGKYGYIIIGCFTGMAGGLFIIDAIQTESFMSVLMGMFFMFVFGFCWSRDSERIKNEKG